MSAQTCPGCTGALEPGSREGAYVCRACGGRYIEREALRALGVSVPPALHRRTPSKPRHCESCDRDMEQVVISAVTLDLCGSCEALFFDAGELEALSGKGGSGEEKLECDRCGAATPIRELVSRDGEALCPACIASDGGAHASTLTDGDFYAAGQHATRERNDVEAAQTIDAGRIFSNPGYGLIGALVDVFLPGPR